MKIMTRVAAASAAAALLALFAGTRAGYAQGFGPPANGTITAIDKTNKTVTINDDQGNPSTIDIDPNATIITQLTIPLSAVKVGDPLRVQGTPTAIAATTIVDGQPPRPGGGGPGGPGAGPGGPGGPGGGPGGPGGGRFGGGPPSVNGTVQSLSPLVVALPSGETVNVTGASSAKISKIATITITDLKVGDRIFALGQQGNDGNVDATFVGVNMQFGGRGGRGGGGGGGFGGGGGGGFGGGGGG